MRPSEHGGRSNDHGDTGQLCIVVGYELVFVYIEREGWRGGGGRPPVVILITRHSPKKNLCDVNCNHISMTELPFYRISFDRSMFQIQIQRATASYPNGVIGDKWSAPARVTVQLYRRFTPAADLTSL